MKIIFDLQACQGRSGERGIGRHSLALAEAMAVDAREHEVWIALNRAIPERIDFLRNKFGTLIPQERVLVWQSITPSAVMGPGNQWRHAASELLRESFFASQNPDIVHTFSQFEGYIDDVISSPLVQSENLPVSYTLYDLIPMYNRELFEQNHVLREWYFQKLKALENAELILSISEYSRLEALKHLPLSPARVTNISSAVNEFFHPLTPNNQDAHRFSGRYGVSKPFILSVLTLDPHKNIDGLLKAYASLPGNLREKHQLVLVTPKEARLQILTGAKREGLHEGEVIVTGHVSDQILRYMFNACSLFVFPSKHEGFGLPVLEAMSCGAPVIGSCVTSISEIIEWKEAMFDPSSHTAIAEKMAQALQDEAFRRELSLRGLKRAKTFSWRACARRAWGALEAWHEEGPLAVHPVPVPTKPTLAYVCSMSAEGPDDIIGLLSELTRYYDIHLVIGQVDYKHLVPDNKFKLIPYELFEETAHEYCRVVYHLGTSLECEQEKIRLLEKYSGVVVLSDIDLSQTYPSDTPQRDSHYQQLYSSHGYNAINKNIDLGGKASGDSDFPCCLRAIELSQGIIASSEEIRTQANRWLGPDFTSEWQIIPRVSLEFAQQDNRPGVSTSHVSQMADSYHTAIEKFAQESIVSHRRRLMHSVAKLAIADNTLPTNYDKRFFAKCVAQNLPTKIQPRIFVDISELAQRDAQGGIQRVVKKFLENMVFKLIDGRCVEPVYAKNNGPLYYAKQWTAQYFNLPGTFTDDPVDPPGPGDLYFMPDYYLLEKDQIDFIQRLQDWGGEAYFIVYDLLPIRRPEWFMPVVNPLFTDFLERIFRYADGILCISKNVADDLFEYLEACRPERSKPLNIGYFHQGSDINSGPAKEKLSAEEHQLLDDIRKCPTFLMVGTVEPRKSHAQALDAFELLWYKGFSINLCIVGQTGWLTDDIKNRVRRLKAGGWHIIWPKHVSDSLLLSLYQESSALLAASEGEGFGLPLIEAAHHGLPIIARDLPVFREVAGEHAFYFSGKSPESLAGAVQEWLKLYQAGSVPSSVDMPVLTWEQSVQQALDVFSSGNWYKAYQRSSQHDLPSEDKLMCEKDGTDNNWPVWRERLDFTSDKSREGGLRINGATRSIEAGKPLITFVTVVRNNEKTLARTIESVQKQKYSNIEHIILDGASTDNTLDLIKQYKAKIDYYASEPDKGLYDALNKVIPLARGDLICVLNSDDWLSDDAAELVASAYGGAEKELVLGAANVIVSERNVSMWLPAKVSANSYFSVANCCHNAIYATKGAYEVSGPYDRGLNIASDFKWIMTCFDAGVTFTYLDKALVNYSMGGVSSDVHQHKHDCHTIIKDRFPFLEDKEVELLSYLFYSLGTHPDHEKFKDINPEEELAGLVDQYGWHKDFIMAVTQEESGANGLHNRPNSHRGSGLKEVIKMRLLRSPKFYNFVRTVYHSINSR